MPVHIVDRLECALQEDRALWIGKMTVYPRGVEGAVEGRGAAAAGFFWGSDFLAYVFVLSTYSTFTFMYGTCIYLRLQIGMFEYRRIANPVQRFNA